MLFTSKQIIDEKFLFVDNFFKKGVDKYILLEYNAWCRLKETL